MSPSALDNCHHHQCVALCQFLTSTLMGTLTSTLMSTLTHMGAPSEQA